MKRAFTLIELLLVLGVFAIFLLAGTDFLIQTIQNSNRSAMENEVRQNAYRILQDIETEARKADPSIGFGFVGGAGNLQMTTANASPTRTVAYSVNAAGILTKTITLGGAVQPTQTLTSTRVAVLNCPSTASGCPSTCAVKGLVVSQAGLADPLVINLTVQNNTTYIRSDFCAKINLSENIIARQY